MRTPRCALRGLCVERQQPGAAASPSGGAPCGSEAVAVQDINTALCGETLRSLFKGGCRIFTGVYSFREKILLQKLVKSLSLSFDVKHEYVTSNYASVMLVILQFFIFSLKPFLPLADSK